MPPRKLYFEAARIGDELPALAKAPIDRVQLTRYAGATGDFSPVFVDEVFARGAGLPSVLAPGSLGMGFLAQLVTDWARGATVRRLSARFVRTLWPLDTLVCKGRVSDREGRGGRYLVELEVWAENQRGELVLKGHVTLQVFYSAEDEARARAGQAPVVVEVPRSTGVAVTPLKAAPSRTAPAPPARAAKSSRPRKAPPARRPAPKRAAARARGKRR
jgi:acyl dehydratase